MYLFVIFIYAGPVTFRLRLLGPHVSQSRPAASLYSAAVNKCPMPLSWAHLLQSFSAPSDAQTGSAKRDGLLQTIVLKQTLYMFIPVLIKPHGYYHTHTHTHTRRQVAVRDWGVGMMIPCRTV